MSGTPHMPPVDPGAVETVALVHAIIGLCDGHDTAAVLAALTTVCAISLDDIGVPVGVFVKRLHVDTAKIRRAKRARKEGSPT